MRINLNPRAPSRRERILITAPALFCVLNLLGCETDLERCEETLTCIPPVVVACNADPGVKDRPVDCEGVYVRAGGNDMHDGTWDRPVETFAQAVKLASSHGRRIYACANVFAEEVRLPPDIEVWGGLGDCADAEAPWPLHAQGELTTIDPGPNKVPLTVAVEQSEPDNTASTKITRLQLIARSSEATVPGGSAIAMMALSGVTVELALSKVEAGDAAPGATGADGGDEPALDGVAGNPGSMACSADTVAGGQRVRTSCDDGDSTGGRGGDGTKDRGGDGEDGTPLLATDDPDRLGRGGSGQTEAFQCQSGREGKNGDDGLDGKGAAGPGRISDSGIKGTWGEDGKPGALGHGGGGGGASRGGAMFCSGNLAEGGASGGAGGAGGCGGKPGRGGGPGGSSIGILSYHATVRIMKTSIITGRGGAGGPGGAGQFGGVGGYGGVGGQRAGGSLPGCRGGDGGTGGNGGRGGGGLGGHSIGIAHTFDIGPDVSLDSFIQYGEPGPGGNGIDINTNAGERGDRQYTAGFQD